MAEQRNEHYQADSQEKLSPGVLLKVAREAKKISLSEAANELRLTTQRLSELENDQFSNMGAETFAKGYLRSYARFLGVPEDQVLHAFESSGFGSDIATYKPQLLNERITESSPRSSSRRLGYIVLLVIAILAAFWWHNRESISESLLDVTTSPSAQNTQENTTQSETTSPSQAAENGDNLISSPVQTGAFPSQDPGMSLINETPKMGLSVESLTPSITPQTTPNGNVQ